MKIVMLGYVQERADPIFMIEFTLRDFVSLELPWLNKTPQIAKADITDIRFELPETFC